MAREVTAELHQKEANRAPLVMGRRVWHGSIQLGWRQIGQDLVDHLLGRLDLSQECRFRKGDSCKFSVAVPLIAVPAYFVPDEVAQVATEVKGEGAHGVREARKPLPQEAVGGGLDFLGKGVQVPRENMPDVLQVLGRFGLIHAANFVKSPLSKWGA